jgi:hypothetical protein
MSDWETKCREAIRERDEARAALAQADRNWKLSDTLCEIARRERDEYKRRLENERVDARGRIAEAWDTCELYADAMNEAKALLAEGLALWDSEPRPGLKSSWFDFWGKVRAACETDRR